MSSDTLFQRLDAEERDVRERLERLRDEIASLEERLAHLAITRRTAVQLLGESATNDTTNQTDEPTPDEPAEEHGESSQTDSAATEPPPSSASEESASQSSEQDQATASAASKPPPRLGPVSKKIVLLVSSSDRPLRARDVAVALGHKDPKRTHIEGARTALQKLVKQGYLAKLEAGLYTSVDSTAKGAA